tara:strand:- start:506 stop:916 length:411 start_codon:yes stop_codon:yes gene_type:complete
MLIESALTCLALNMYFEARNQSIDGQIAVNSVVLNRVKSNKYPNNICSVVKQGYMTKQGHMIKNKCQFSWYCDGLSDIPTDKDAYRWSLHVSMMVLYGVVSDQTGGALFYHSLSVNPKWSIRKQPLEIIGDHIFYK